jgi:hypothetical protein
MRADGTRTIAFSPACCQGTGWVASRGLAVSRLVFGLSIAFARTGSVVRCRLATPRALRRADSVRGDGVIRCFGEGR